MSSRFFKQPILSLLIAALLVPSSMFLYPTTANAQSTNCVAPVARAIAAAIGISAFTKVIGVTGSNPGGEAFDAVTAGGQFGEFFNTCILKPIAIQMARTMARNISNSIVNWINNDFQGKPGFVTDFDGMVADSADQTIGNFIYGSDLKFLCQPFAFKIRLQLATKYSQPFQKQIRCTLSDIGGNVSGFAKSNGGSGWNHWLEITTQPQNNEYGALLLADSQLAQNVQGGLDKVNNMLNRNGGFLDYKVCDKDAKDKETDAEVKSRIAGAKASQEEYGNQFSAAADLDPTPRCKTGGRTVTPGSLVQEQANKVLGGWADQLNLATDINQIVGALISHFADKMISGAQGFLGLSQSGGYAKSTVNYTQASNLSTDELNPDNAGLNDVNAAAAAGADQVSDLLSATQVSASQSIATGASVSMSSSGIGSSAWVTDGDVSTSAATGETSNPWIEVDLGQSATVSEIHVWSPIGKSAAESLGTFHVVVSNSSGMRDFVSNESTVSDSSPNPTVVALNRTGRFIRVERSDNSYGCGKSSSGGSICYRPLEIGEIEVVISAATLPDQTSAAPSQAGTVISVGPVSGPNNVPRNSQFSFNIPIAANIDTSISVVEVRLYRGSELVSFDSAFSNGVVGLKQQGTTRNVFPTGAPGVDFTAVSAGPSSNSSITVSGTAFPPSNTVPYRLVVTAKSSPGTVLGTATANFVVQ